MAQGCPLCEEITNKYKENIVSKNLRCFGQTSYIEEENVNTKKNTQNVA